MLAVEADDGIARGVDEMVQIQVGLGRRALAGCLRGVHVGVGARQGGTQAGTAAHVRQGLVEHPGQLSALDDRPVRPEQWRRAELSAQRTRLGIGAEEQQLAAFPAHAQLAGQADRAQQARRQHDQRRLRRVARQLTGRVEQAQLAVALGGQRGDPLVQCEVAVVEQRQAIELQLGVHSSGRPSRLRPVQSLSRPVVGVITCAARASRSRRATRLFAR